MSQIHSQINMISPHNLNQKVPISNHINVRLYHLITSISELHIEEIDELIKIYIAVPVLINSIKQILYFCSSYISIVVFDQLP